MSSGQAPAEAAIFETTSYRSLATIINKTLFLLARSRDQKHPLVSRDYAEVGGRADAAINTRRKIRENHW